MSVRNIDFDKFYYTVDGPPFVLTVSCGYCNDDFQESFTKEFPGGVGKPLSLLTGWAQLHFDKEHLRSRMGK